MSVCILGKYKKYFVVNEIEIQAKPKYCCYFRGKKTYYFEIKILPLLVRDSELKICP